MSQAAETGNKSARVRVIKPQPAPLLDWNRKVHTALRRPSAHSQGQDSSEGDSLQRKNAAHAGSTAGATSEPAAHFAADLSQIPIHSTGNASSRAPVTEDGAGEREETTRSAYGAASISPGNQMLFRNGGGGGGGGGGAGGGGAPASVIPTGIANTSVHAPTPSLGPTYYGSIFKHNLSTGGGTISADVTVAEKVDVTRDDFNTGFTGVPLGTLTWGAAAGCTAPLYGNSMYDNIGTNNINVTNFVPGPPGLPAIMQTPQELHYRIGTGSWVKFADVPMVVTLRQTPAPMANAYEVETRVNNVPSVQPYTGPT